MNVLALVSIAAASMLVLMLAYEVGYRWERRNNSHRNTPS
jgi:hypothetical protein